MDTPFVNNKMDLANALQKLSGRGHTDLLGWHASRSFFGAEESMLIPLLDWGDQACHQDDSWQA